MILNNNNFKPPVTRRRLVTYRGLSRVQGNLLARFLRGKEVERPLTYLDL